MNIANRNVWMGESYPAGWSDLLYYRSNVRGGRRDQPDRNETVDIKVNEFWVFVWCRQSDPRVTLCFS